MNIQPKKSEKISDTVAEERINKAIKTNDESLSLFNLRLRKVPESIGCLKQLKRLNLSENCLTSLPDSIGQLTQLQELLLWRNQLKTLPSSLSNLTRLQTLNIARNQLKELPEWIGQLKELRELNILGNQLTNLPEAVGNLDQLITLIASDNELRLLPECLRGLKLLKMLFLQGNYQLSLPLEILGPDFDRVFNKGFQVAKPKDILNYYFSVGKSLNEAKLILVGRGGVGKTSLVNRLVRNTFNECENKTEGIQITYWTVHIDQDDIDLNIWDFGGQEIMHATHQFFLTERSLYLLVLNGREGFQEYDVEYWLKLIESFGGESPIIIILNKIKECPFELNYQALRAKYPQIRGFMKTDCDPEIGINELRKEIFNRINQLRDVRARFPASWFSIKDRLSGMQENYLSLDRYRELCRQQGEQDEKAQDDLAGFLHCLGIALHYRDDPRLRDTSILNPHWVTNGIYRLLNAKRLAENKGILRLENLQELLPATDYLLEKHEFLLELMRKFNLCFAFPDDPQHRYLVPELLDIQEPPLTERFDPKECLNFEYHYKILPEGLLPNFIVRTHILSTNQPRWRSGVVLAWEGCHALVKADTADRKVTICLQGASAEGRRRLLAVIRSDFERIHSDIPRLEVIPKVPVPDYPKVALEYKKLCAFEEAGELELKEYIDGKIVKLNVRDLLNGVDLTGTRLKERHFERGPAPLKLFYSYSHKDETLRDELETHLKLLQRQGEISTWHDRKILGGDEWKGKIDENLEAADIVLLLVSADFLASDYCYDIEMKRALERHEAGQARVIPVILRDCDWNHALSGKLQALPENGNPVTLWTNKDTAWKDVAQGIRYVVRKIRERKAE